MSAAAGVDAALYLCGIEEQSRDGSATWGTEETALLVLLDPMAQ